MVIYAPVRCPAILAPACSGDVSRLSPQALQHVAGAAGKLGGVLGPWLGALFPALLREGFDLHAALLPALVHAIAAGPRGDGAPAGAWLLMGGLQGGTALTPVMLHGLEDKCFPLRVRS